MVSGCSALLLQHVEVPTLVHRLHAQMHVSSRDNSLKS